MKYTEYQEQVKLFSWARHRLILQKYPMLSMLYCNHNTQKLNFIQANRWKAAGGKSGVPDIFLAYPKISENIHGLYIEMKSPDLKPKTPKSKGGLKDHQIEFISQLRNQGYQVNVCYSADEAIIVIEEYLTRYPNELTMQSIENSINLRDVHTAKSIQELIEDAEDIYESEQIMHDIRIGKSKTISLEEMEKIITS